jgi:RNA polymerase sigma-70 factor, ECF subfamily
MENKPEIFDQIWNDSRSQLKAFIKRRIKNEADAEDILQSVFLKIHQNIEKLSDNEKLYAWIYRITRNAITDYYRTNNENLQPLDEEFNQSAGEEFSAASEEEVLSWLRPMIEDLPEKYGQALLLTDIEGATQKDLAERLDISLSGAKSRVQRAREQLKERLLNCCHIEFDRQGRVIEYQQKQEDCHYCQVKITRS